LETLKQLKWEAYSPDLVPSDFHLFRPLKEAVRGRQFSCDDDVKAAVHQWLHAQPNTIFCDGIKQLVG
jgi:histone-lysine N-methyltransferase SETMAR